ncbi:MAG: zinc-ribbon domain-containing protein [Clostridia bacterium]|nr:zinc-ribbon domain-containing protein [Clostridia bacterium]
MAKCPKCGVELEEGAKFCNACGEKLETAKVNADDIAGKVGDVANDAVENLKKLNDTADTTSEYDAKDIADNKILSLFAYIGILFLIPLLAAPKSKYARFHTNQGIVLFIVNIILNIAVAIVSAILGFIALGVIGMIIGWVVSVVQLVLMILGIVNAVTGKAKELPVIGKIRILK